MRTLDPPRQLSPWEHDILAALLAVPFPGWGELREQLNSIKVVEEYGGDDPSVVFRVDRHAALPAPVQRRIPVEAEGLDADGATIQVLLHVLDGFVWELELYRPDGNPVKRAPDARSLTLYSPDYHTHDRGQTDRVLGTA